MAAQIPYLDPTAVANDITLLLPVIKMIGGLIPGVAGNSIVALIAGLLANPALLQQIVTEINALSGAKPPATSTSSGHPLGVGP